MCFGEVVAKYVLFFANLFFVLAGATIIGLGIAVLVLIGDLQDILPVNIIPITLIVLGVIIFVVAFFACCGAIKESRCMLITYAVVMSVLAASKLALGVVIFTNLSLMEERIVRWLNNAFFTASLRGTFHVMEILFSCCGTTGPSSYQGIMVQLPPSCCASPINNVCPAPEAFPGCTNIIIDYFDIFGEAIGSVLFVIIAVEIVAVVMASFFTYSISNKRKRNQMI